MYQYKVTVNGNDGQFLVGGNPLTVTFECGDEFFAHGAANYGTEDVDYLVDELAKDVSGGIYWDLEEDVEAAEERGEDSEEVWRARHDADGYLRLTSPDELWKITIGSFWGVTDGIALTTGETVVPLLRQAIEDWIEREDA